MPIYEYQCNQCQHRFEKIQKISDGPWKICPSCQGESVKKLISNTHFRLKGTGWYVTDFRDKGKKPEASSADAASGSKSSAATGTAPVTTSSQDRTDS